MRQDVPAKCHNLSPKELSNGARCTPRPGLALCDFPMFCDPRVHPSRMDFTHDKVT